MHVHKQLCNTDRYYGIFLRSLNCTVSTMELPLGTTGWLWIKHCFWSCFHSVQISIFFMISIFITIITFVQNNSVTNTKCTYMYWHTEPIWYSLKEIELSCATPYHNWISPITTVLINPFSYSTVYGKIFEGNSLHSCSLYHEWFPVNLWLCRLAIQVYKHAIA